MNNMSSLSVYTGEREVEVSLLEVLYYIVSPSLFPSFPFILLLQTTTFHNNLSPRRFPIFPLASKIMLVDIYRKRD